jgi:ferritin-like metal-binding protein YciE
MKLDSLKDVLEHELQDLYDAEQQITKAMPDMIEAVDSDQLKQSFSKHAKQTETQLERLKEAAEKAGLKVKGESCEAMAGILREGKKLFKADKGPLLDTAIISAAKRIEHYEIAGYNSLISLAESIDENQVVELLKQNLHEEEQTDAKLEDIADTIIASQVNGS